MSTYMPSLAEGGVYGPGGPPTPHVDQQHMLLQLASRTNVLLRAPLPVDLQAASVASVPIEVTPADAFIPSATAASIEIPGGGGS